MGTRLTRRDFLRVAPLSVVGVALLAACGASPTPSPPPAASQAPRPSLAPAASAAPVASAAATVPSAAPAASSAGGATPVKGGTFTYGNSKPPTNVISPLNTVGTGQNVLIEALFLRLVYGRQWGNGINPQAGGAMDLAVAEKMVEIEKDRVWDFTLRKDVKWHDGKPVTVDDVIFGIWLSLNKDAKGRNETPVGPIKGADKLKNQGGGSLTPPYTVEIEGAKKIDENTVRIELDLPIANYWINWGVGYWPMPKHIFGQMPMDKMFDEPYATMPVGNGPFKAVKYVDSQYMEMAANPDFYLGRPNVDKYVVRFGDADTLTAALEAGEIDGSGVSAGAVYDRLTKLPNIVGNAVPRDHPDGFSVNRKHFAKEAPALLKAMMYAIDVDSINKQLYSGTLRPSNYLFEHVVGLETPPAGLPKYGYDPEKAKAILKEAGWDASKELRWIMWSKPAALQDAQQAMLAAVGINAKYKVIDVAAITEQYYRGSEWDLVFGNFGADQNMEQNWKYIKTDWGYDQGGGNHTGYGNKAADDLWAKALKEVDAVKRKALYDQVSLLLAADPPQATLWRQSILYAWNKRVKGAYPYQYRLPVRPALEKVYIEK